MLVEDDRSVRAATRRLLTLDGHTVIQAEDGASALALSNAHDGNIDVLLTDVVMPGMSGPQLARRIREQRPQIGVILTSGHTGSTLDERNIEPSDAVFLQKPVSREAFAKAISSLVG